MPTRRNRFVSFITAISILGVLFGTAALLISMSILDGFEQTLRANMISFVGHIEVTAFKDRQLPDYRQVVADLPRAVPEVTQVSPFVRREAILRSRAGLEGVWLKGIVPSIDVSSIRGKIVQGTFSFPDEDDGHLPPIVIGERLARKLELSVGDTAVLFGPNGVPTPENPPTIEQFIVRGIYRTGMAEYDDIYTFTSLAAAQRLYAFPPDAVSGYDLLIDNVDSVEQVARRLDTVLGWPYYPQTVYEIFPAIFAWLDLQRVPIPIVLGLISIVAIFNIISTLLIVILEKTESIGVLSTLGARRSHIMAIFVGQGLLIGGVGTLLGALLSLGFTLIQSHFHILSLDADIYFIDAVPVALTPWHYALVLSASILLCVVSTLIPAYVASRLRPVEALRFQ